MKLHGFLTTLLAIIATTVTVAAGYKLSSRPVLRPMPYNSRMPFPNPPARDSKVCVVNTHGDGVTDDSFSILFALWDCNDGGHVLFPRGETYTIGTALDLTFLKHIDIDIQGRIQFTNDTTYWQANSFSFIFQNVTSFFKLGGEDVWIYGDQNGAAVCRARTTPNDARYFGDKKERLMTLLSDGTIDGNGQVWYDTYAANIYTLRPVLVGIDGLRDSVLSNLVLRHSPQYYHFVANASNVVFNNIDIAGGSTSKNKASNSDGWDTYRSRDVTIMNSVINNGDDCVSFKPNSSHILVQSLSCTGSHGISVGSLGQYPGTFDIVESLMISNITMRDASDGARIKVWPNTPSAMSADLQGGGGSGRVSNITYEDMRVKNVDYAIEITQCYGQKNLSLCQQFPSELVIEDIVFKRFSGTTASKYEPLIAAFACSSDKVCGNITATDIKVKSPKGKRQAYCLNQVTRNLDVECTSNYKGFN
ncbi:exopolygalacturonase [Apodospora peruviana]|uniref:galacturonan 1,4-alpha-galacturonidase n=1 Tax=Apodospora peruviana TaxID=516989 RepID=A0AAE0IQG5_9PEZI|nr:exopolygalacturonase [Apodospora peruviana]